MKSKLIHETDGQRTFAIVFDAGDEVLSGIENVARAGRLGASQLTAIGAFDSVVLGYFEWERKTYRRIAVNDQVEVLSLVGNVVLEDGVPKVHAHVVVGKRDGSAHGGHLMKARVRPTLEVIVVEAPKYLERRHDAGTGLALIHIE
jgi:hypothetical protein